MKNIYILLLACFFSITANSQNYEIGIKTGVNLTKLRTSGYSGTGITGGSDILTRLNVSVGLEYSLTNKFGLDISLGYQGKGGGDFEENNKLYFGIPDFNRKLDYVNMSILFRYYPFNNSDWQPFLTFGPGISYLISAKQMNNKIDENDIRSKLEISSIVGLGLKYNYSNDLKFELLGGLDRGWSKIIRQQNESLFNEVIWVNFGIKKSF